MIEIVNLKDLLQSSDLQRTKRESQQRESEVIVMVADQGPSEILLLEDKSLLGENFDFEYPASLSAASTADSTDAVSKIEVARQTEYRSPEKEIRDYFIDQATCPKNCYRYTGVTRSKLGLLFEFLPLT